MRARIVIIEMRHEAVDVQAATAEVVHADEVIAAEVKRDAHAI